MPGKTLLAVSLDGRKTDLAVAIASVFAVRGFTHVALVSPDSDQLSKDEDRVLDAIQERGYSCQTKTIQSPLDSRDSGQKIVEGVHGWGELEAIFWDGASTDAEVARSKSLAQTLTSLLKEAIPQLCKQSGQEGRSPSVIVAGPAPSLDTAVKEADAGKVHVALLDTAGKAVDQAADSAWELYQQPKGHQ